jgi:hypothetical protein
MMMRAVAGTMTARHQVGVVMPSLIFEYEDEWGRLPIEQALAKVADLRRAALEPRTGRS